MTSNETDFYVTVPRSCVNEFRSKYHKLVETFYYVTLTESKLSTAKQKPEFVFFKVIFNLNPSDGNYNPAELVARIQNYVESSLGWSGERAEDSSYDSECEDEAGHRAASRTPSDTLAAEFAEYVTLATPPDPDQAQIDFALKLGYPESLARIALQRLGPEPSKNDFISELIKLASKQPPRPVSPSPPFEPDPPPDRSSLRHIVIDGSNVAMSHGNKEVFSCRGIEICVNWFRARGHKDITVFVPKWRKEAPRPDNPVTNREALNRLEKERVLVYTPSRCVGGKRLVCYDDRYILRLAAETQGIVVSNDTYRDLTAENPEFRKVVEERLLMFSFVNDRFMPPDDPLGRSGPTLEAFLRIPSKSDAAPACPYGRKCTYGNKCKFYHPERANRPNKSTADKVSERGPKTTKARGLHTLSLPPSGRPTDNKLPLARAHSATPRLPDATLATHFDRAQILPGPSQPPPEVYANPHRKLARQLTLNPACDPRLLHTAAGRVASAPVGAAAYIGNGMSLTPYPSESALQHWEARRRMHFHLTGIFPEAQVAEVMAAFPEETNAQTMCAIILDRYRPSEAPLMRRPPL